MPAPLADLSIPEGLGVTHSLRAPFSGSHAIPVCSSSVPTLHSDPNLPSCYLYRPASTGGELSLTSCLSTVGRDAPLSFLSLSPQSQMAPGWTLSPPWPAQGSSQMSPPTVRAWPLPLPLGVFSPHGYRARRNTAAHQSVMSQM